MARHGFLFGGSTGTVVSGAMRWLAEHDDGRELTAVAISPDLGERYLDTVYQSNWLQDLYGEEVIGFDEGAEGSWATGPMATRQESRPPHHPQTGDGGGGWHHRYQDRKA